MFGGPQSKTHKKTLNSIAAVSHGFGSADRFGPRPVQWPKSQVTKLQNQKCSFEGLGGLDFGFPKPFRGTLAKTNELFKIIGGVPTKDYMWIVLT